MTIKIRHAREEEKDRLTGILRAVYRTNMAPLLPPAAMVAFEAEDAAGSFVGACWQDFHVAEVEGIVVGILFLDDNKVESLHVHPGSQGSGVGRALLRHGEDLISQTSTHALLEVLERNTAAQGFYKAQGWHFVEAFEGLEVGDIPVPMHLMRKDLRG